MREAWVINSASLAVPLVAHQPMAPRFPRHHRPQVRRQKASRDNLAAMGRDSAPPRPSVCFQGSGCVIVYHIGVARYLQEHFDLSDACFLGASGGSIVAAMLGLGFSMDLAMRENLRVSLFSRSWPFGPFGRILDDVAEAFTCMLAHWTDDDVRLVLAGLAPQLPVDIEPGSGVGRSHEFWGVGTAIALPPPQLRPQRPPDTAVGGTAVGDTAVGGTAVGGTVIGGTATQMPRPISSTPSSPTAGSPSGSSSSGDWSSPKPPPQQQPWRNRLLLSITHCSSWAPRLMRHYPTKDVLVNTVWSSMNLPIFFCRFRSILGSWYLDGGLTNNAPVLTPQTVRVSPTDRLADVTPDTPATAAEFLVPGDGPYMVRMHDQGYENARRCHDLFVARGFKPKVSNAK